MLTGPDQSLFGSVSHVQGNPDSGPSELDPSTDSTWFGGFPFVACRTCARDVVAYAALVDGEVAYVCSVCGGGGQVEFAERSALDALGLTVAARPILEPKVPKKGGCSKGCKSSRQPGGSANAGDEASSCGGSCSCSTK